MQGVAEICGRGRFPAVVGVVGGRQVVEVGEMGGREFEGRVGGIVEGVSMALGS